MNLNGKKAKGESSSKYRVNARLSWGLTVSFLIAVGSGILLAYPFSEATPFVSTVGIENVVPFGRFFRRVHYFSGFLTVVLLLYHAGEALLARAYERRNVLQWFFLTFAGVLTLLIAFTGYIARWDETGRLAGAIAESLSLKVPLLGNYLNGFLFLTREGGVHRAYTFHFYASFLVLFLAGIWHFRLRRLPFENFALFSLVVGTLALLFPVGLHAPGPYLLVKGPWFFLGIQEALRYVPPEVAGLMFPALGPFFYWVVKWSRIRKLALCGLVLWALLYGGLTIYGLWR